MYETKNKINIKINENDFEFIDDNSLTLKAKENKNNIYPIIINPDNWILEEGENYFYMDWLLAGLKTIDTIIIDGLPSYFWEFGLEAEIIENGIKFSIPKQFGGDQNSETGKPLSSLVLNATVIKAETTSIAGDVPIVQIEDQRIITGILTGTVDKFDTIYSKFVSDGSDWDTVHNKLSNPADLPTGTIRNVSFSSNDTYLAVAHQTSPYFTVYKRSGDTFNELTGIEGLPGAGSGVSFSSDGTYLAVSHYGSPCLTVYKR